MKKKMPILVGIAVCVLLLTSPVLASAGYSKIYGNANEDDVLDMRDVTYIKLVIFGNKPATTLADANNDGKISMLDVGQAKLIILDKEKELTLVDMADRIVTVPRPIERVVSFSLGGGVRPLVQLGAVDKLVGGPGYLAEYGSNTVCLRAYPQLAELPAVGKSRDPNLEVILPLKPDMIFIHAVAGSDVADMVQEKINIPVVCISGYPTGATPIAYSDQFDSSFDVLRLVGTVIGKEKDAEELISYASKRLDKMRKITSEIPASEKPKVYLAFWTGLGTITHTPAAVYAPVEIAGGINVAENPIGPGPYGPAMWEISIEQIVAWNPDIILIMSSSKTHSVSIEDVLSDPRLQTINAVKNRKIYYTKGFFHGWDPATGITEAFYMPKLFYPEKFEDLDIEKECNERLERFYGVDGLYIWMAEWCDLHRWE